jgi:hypothetical protein
MITNAFATSLLAKLAGLPESGDIPYCGEDGKAYCRYDELRIRRSSSDIFFIEAVWKGKVIWQSNPVVIETSHVLTLSGLDGRMGVSVESV